MNTYGIALLIALALIVAIFLFERITGRNTLVYILAGKPILSALTLLAKAIHGATNNAWFHVLYVTMSAAIDATERAEQLWKNGELPKDQREDFASLMIAGALKDAGITVTDDLQTIIDGCVAMVCYLLPHESKPDPDMPKEVGLE